MSTMRYVGARYVPKWYVNSVDDTANWEINVEYEPLTYVTTQNNHLYISKKTVPDNIGTPAENTEYWLDMGTFSGSYADLIAMIGDLGDLTTTDKSNLVSAINEINSSITPIDSVINVKQCLDNGEKPQDYMNDAVAFYVPSGTHEFDLLIDKQYVTVFGEGTIKGSITIDLQPNPSFTNAYSRISGVRFTKNTNNFAIRLKQARYIMIDNIWIDSTFDYGIYFNETLSSAYNRWLHDIKVTDSMINGGYPVYINPNSNYSAAADIYFTNNTFRASEHAAIYMINIDGVTIDCNTLFTEDRTGSNSYGIYIQNSTWTHISNNNIFEFGNVAIYLSHYSQIEVDNNSIGYCGEIIPASGIYLDNYQWGAESTGIVQLSSIHDNIIYKPTLSGIQCGNHVGYLKIHDNIITGAGSSERYAGSTDLSTLNHYGIDIGTVDANSGNNVYNNYSTNSYNILNTRVFARNNQLGYTEFENREVITKDYTISNIDLTSGFSSHPFTYEGIPAGYKLNAVTVTGVSPTSRAPYLIVSAFPTSATNALLNIYNGYGSTLHADDIIVRFSFVPIL